MKFKLPVKFQLLVICLYTGISGLAQQALPDSIVEERLVELALNSPVVKSGEYQGEISEYQLKRAKSTWLNLLTISGNYNDQTFAKNTPTGVVYPKYFFGLTVPLGIIFSQGNDVKSARASVEMTKQNQEQLKRNIRADIIGKYRQFKMYNELITLQNQVIDDEQAAVAQAEKNFSEGRITIELYNAAAKKLSDEVAKRINLKMSQELLRLEIERIIGVPLESVMR